MAWLMKPIYAWALGSLVLLLFLGAIYAAGANSQKPKIKALQQAVADYSQAFKDEKTAYDTSQRLRKAYRKTAEDRVTTLIASCDTRITGIRQSEDELRKLANRRPKTDAKGCAIQDGVWWADPDLRPSIRPGAR